MTDLRTTRDRQSMHRQVNRSQPALPGTTARRALDTVFKRSREATFVVNAASGNIVASNRGAERLFGYSSAEMLGQAAEVFCFEGGTVEHLTHTFTSVLKGGGAAAMRSSMVRRDGTVFTARNRVVAIDTPGQTNFVLWLVRDADESSVAVRNEILERELFRIGAASRATGDTWQLLLERFSREFDWDYAEVWGPRSGRLAQAAWWSPDDSRKIHHFAHAALTIGFRAGEGLPGRVWQSDGTEWLSDVHKVPESVFLRTAIAKSTGLTTFFAAPVRLANHATHVVVFANEASRRPDQDVLALTEEACHGIAHFVTDDYIPDDNGSEES